VLTADQGLGIQMTGGGRIGIKGFPVPAGEPKFGLRSGSGGGGGSCDACNVEVQEGVSRVT